MFRSRGINVWDHEIPIRFGGILDRSVINIVSLHPGPYYSVKTLFPGVIRLSRRTRSAARHHKKQECALLPAHKRPGAGCGRS
jgi:hypothetical protein